ncbi:FMN-binding negative transcriptional regulator [Streptomyces sp. NPDC050842]|uniref:FMN-binding negative transcriptional regulator n=1 Tax=Streptomyces sp. NPDC050842 TaxID=3365636 RepID=UPI003791B1EF
MDRVGRREHGTRPGGGEPGRRPTGDDVQGVRGDDPLTGRVEHPLVDHDLGAARAKPDTPPTDGVPTSYYAAVQFICQAHIVDEPEAKAELLRRQMAQFQPDGDHAPIEVDQTPYGRMLPGIRGLTLEVTEVRAKFKYDDHKPVEHRATVAERLTDRKQALDEPTARQQRRRLDRIGPWKP